MRRLVQNNAINGLVGGVQDAHRQAILLVRPDDVRHVEDEGRLASLVRPHRRVVQPHVGLVVHLPEAEEDSPARDGIGRGREFLPIPGHAVVAGKASWMIHGTFVRLASGRGAVHHWPSRPAFCGSVASSHWPSSDVTGVPRAWGAPTWTMTDRRMIPNRFACGFIRALQFPKRH